MSTFDFNGIKYKSASTHQKEWGSKIISELQFTGKERVLDLGCGDGFLTRLIADFLPRGSVLGIDASEGMIKAAREYETENVSFQLMDIDAVDFENEFDLIFSNAALHWINDHVRLLDNCHKALKPGGCIRFNFAGYGNCSNFNEIIKKIILEERYSAYFEKFIWPWYMPEKHNYQKLAENSSFKDINIWEENTDRFFPSQDEMIKWIDQPSIVPFVACVDEKDKISFRDEVVNRMIQKTKQSDGRYFETFRRINVFGRRN
jgi:trans-aconitate 2-methyltransferase